MCAVIPYKQRQAGWISALLPVKHYAQRKTQILVIMYLIIRISNYNSLYTGSSYVSGIMSMSLEYDVSVSLVLVIQASMLITD